MALLQMGGAAALVVFGIRHRSRIGVRNDPEYGKQKEQADGFDMDGKRQ